MIGPRLSGHLRRSSALILAPVTLGVIIWTSWSDFHSWRWEWGWGMLNPGSGWPVFASLLAAGTAIDAVRSRTLLKEVVVEKIEIRRSIWPAFIVPTAIVAGIWVLSLLPTAAMLQASGAIGRIHWWGLFGQGSGIVMFGAAGALLGTLVPRWWMPPLAGLAAYFGPFLGLFVLDLWIPVPSLVGGYTLGSNDFPASPILIGIITAGLVMMLAPFGRLGPMQRLPAALVGLATVAHIVLLPAILPEEEAVQSAEIAGCESSPVLQLEVCGTSPYLPFLEHVGQVGDTVLASAGNPIPRLIVVDLNSIDYLTTDSGVLVGVNAGMVRPEWRPDPRVYPNDLGHQILESVISGFCSPSSSEWGRDIAREILFVSSLPGWPVTFADTYASQFHSGGSPPDTGPLQKLWNDVADGCQEGRLRATLAEMGISE